ncbi:MAG: Gfo/Idh/MocA family protein [Christensenellales bacterium]|jgi:predicted dehydrogenase
MKPVNVAMIGVGNISGIYLQNLTKVFRDVRLIGVCDLVRERAEKAQAAYGVPKIYETMHDAFADPEVELVLNITRPYEHYAVSKAALEAGKHVYSEKPLAATLEEGKALVELARSKKLLLGGAPDTFLGAGIQTCRRLIDDGYIGDVIGAAGFMIGHGPESWHEDPDFFYQHGGGPMLDMGPYYLTALINLCGGISRVVGAARKSFDRRLITSKPFAGTPIHVNVDTYVAGTMQFESGAIGTLFTTFDVYYPYGARLEIYGSRGTLFVPDPNTFGGPVKLFRPEDGEVREIPLMYSYRENSRGLGLDDFAVAIRTGRDARCDCAQTFHVLDAMTGFIRSARSECWVELSTKYRRALAMVPAELAGVLNE